MLRLYLSEKIVMRKRVVVDGEVHHIYQKAQGGFVIFYSLRDYLVFFTIFCSVAEKMDILVMALCPMPDHFHNVCRFKEAGQMTKFVQLYSRLFSREWNKSRKRKGVLIQKRFGSAVKLGNKQVRTTINYNNNNPVERKITLRAEDYRWNFLRYFRSRNPFSKKLVESEASSKLRASLQEVRDTRKSGDWVRYAQLDRWMKDLSTEEIQQLADYIITAWNVIDYVGAISYYGDYDAMIRSFHDNTGSEYDIKEDSDKYSDSVYSDCTKLLIQVRKISSIREIPNLQAAKKLELYKFLSARTAAKPSQLYKYLHLNSG